MCVVTKQQRDYYVSTVFRLMDETGKSLHEIVELCEVLHQAERAAHRIAERQCNGYKDRQGNWDDAAAAADERSWEKWFRKVADAVECLGIQVHFNGDPRGSTVCLYLPSGCSNNWDGKTWRVNWV